MSEEGLVGCPSCGATNRVPREKLDQGRIPVCGRCKTRLPVEVRPVTVTDASFEADVERCPLPVLVDAWAAWCGPCRMIGPVVDDLAREMAGRARVAKLNVDENPVTAERFNIRSIPTLLLFNEGREIDRIVGVRPRDEIRQRLESAIAGVQAAPTS